MSSPFGYSPTQYVFVVATVMLSLAARDAGAQGSTAVPSGEVRASGSASVTVEPDLALVTVQYSASGRTPAIAGRAAARRANAIRAAIIALGVPADSIPTSGRWGQWGNRSEMQVRNDMRDTSYVTNDAFVVRLRDLSLVGRVIDTALTGGAQTISNVQFLATDTETATLEAIRLATRQARSRAQAAAEASGLRIGRTMDIGIDGTPTSLASNMQLSEGRMSRADAGTTVVAPELQVSVSVSGRWEMLPPGGHR